MAIDVYEAKTHLLRRHILKAMTRTKTNGVPERAQSTVYDVLSPQGERFPPKLVLSYALELAIGKPVPRRELMGGRPTNDMLRAYGFEVVVKVGMPASQLRQLALEEGRRKPKSNQTYAPQFQRSAAVSAYVKAVANGHCDLCGKLGPFRLAGVPFLECHHIEFLSEGGSDTILNAVAVCPNCHRRLHLLQNAEDHARLVACVQAREASVSQ